MIHVRSSLTGIFILCTVIGCANPPQSPEPATTPDYAIIEVFAGTGSDGVPVDGMLALNADLGSITDMEIAPDGTIFLADFSGSRIYEIRDRVIRTVVGSQQGWATTGPLPNHLSHASDISIDPVDRLVVSNWFHHDIYIADIDENQMWRIAGTTECDSHLEYCGGFAGDGGSALDAHMAHPSRTTFDDRGNLVVLDQGNGRIRRIRAIDGLITREGVDEPGSTIETIAGRGTHPFHRPEPSFNGNDISAMDAVLGFWSDFRQTGPQGGLAFRDGTLYVCDTWNHMVRAILPDGTIRLVAGGGLGLDDRGVPQWGWTGDGGPATEATLFGPMDLAFDGRGNLYIADTLNSSIRRVDTDGIITTFAGQGFRNPDADQGNGGPPTEAFLDRPWAVAVDTEDNVYIADRHNHQVRIVRR